MTQGYISSDGHVIEPPDIFTTRLDKRFRDRAPHIETNDQGWVTYVIGEGLPLVYPGVLGATGRLGLSMDEARKMGFEALRPSGWDPNARIKDQDIDGVIAEVVYPTIGRRLFDIADVELRRACFTAYNDWLAEFCAPYPHRLIGVALIDLEDVSYGVGEIERWAKRGLKAAGIWEAPPEDRPYSSPTYDSLWRAIVDHNMSAALHVGTGATAQAKKMHTQSSQAAAKLTSKVSVNQRLIAIQDTLQDLTAGGVLERHPKLKVASVENNIGWVPYYIQALDHGYEKMLRDPKNPLPMKPSDYIKRQVYFTFENDPFGARTSEIFGEDNYLWASDFPHPAATWPDSRKVIETTFAGISPTVVRKIVTTNAAKLYGIPIN